MHTMFSKVEVSLNDTEFDRESGTNLYPYRAFLHTLINLAGSNDGPMTTQFYLRDYGSEEWSLQAASMQNRSRYMDGKVMTLESRVYSDMCNLQKYIPNNVEVRLKLQQSRDAFRLNTIGATNYKLKLLDASYRVCFMKPSPTLMLNNEKAFEKKSAEYNYHQTVMRANQLPEGTYTANFEQMFNSRVPLEVTAVLVPAKAFAGDFTVDAFQFKPYNLEEMALYIDGNQTAAPAIQCNFDQNDYTEAYLRLYKWHDPSQNFDVNYETFAKYRAIFTFDLAPFLANDHIFPINKTGNVRLCIKFREALPEPATLIIFARLQSSFKIDWDRKITQT